jgi:hypothetical protein
VRGNKLQWSINILSFLQSKEGRKKPDGFYSGKKIRDMKVIFIYE